MTGPFTDADLDVMYLEFISGRTPLAAARPMLPHEVRAGVDFAGIEAALTAAQAATQASLDAVRDVILLALAQRLNAARFSAAADDALQPVLTDFLAAQPPGVRQAVARSKAEIARELALLHNKAQRHAAAEAAHQGVAVPHLAAADAGDYIAAAASAPESIWPRIAQAALAANGNRPATPEQIVTDARAASIKGPQDLARQGTHVAYAQGRLSAIAAMPPPPQIYASELLDSETCENCAAVDGREYASLDEALGDYPDGGVYANCDGGDRCRGTLVVVYDTEDNPVAGGSTGPEPPPPWEPPEGLLPIADIPVATIPPPAPEVTPPPVVQALTRQLERRAERAAEKAERQALRSATEDDLAARLDAAYLDDTAEGSARADRIEAEFDRREAARQLREAKAAARAEAKTVAAEAKAEAQGAEMQRLMEEEGYSGLEAQAEVMGGNYERMEQQAILDYLRANGSGNVRGGYLHATEMEYRSAGLNAEMDRAEGALRGGDWRNLEGQLANKGRGVDHRRLFWTKDDAWARRYASQELKQYWDAHGRLTLESYRDSLKEAVTGVHTKRDVGPDWHQ